nr:hypothetical protein [Blautia marasmi]
MTKNTFGHTHAQMHLLAKRVDGPWLLAELAVIIETIVQTAFIASTWITSRGIVNQTAMAAWSQSVYGSGKAANGQLFIVARFAES